MRREGGSACAAWCVGVTVVGRASSAVPPAALIIVTDVSLDEWTVGMSALVNVVG